LSVPHRVSGALLSTLLVGVVVGCSSEDNPPAVSTASVVDSSGVAQPTASTGFEVHPPLAGAVASSMAADLGSGDQARVTAQVVLPTSVSIDPSVYQQLQALSPITIDDSSFKQLSDTEAQVYANAGANQTEWTLFLLWQDNRWQLADTLEGKQ